MVADHPERNTLRCFGACLAVCTDNKRVLPQPKCCEVLLPLPPMSSEVHSIGTRRRVTCGLRVHTHVFTPWQRPRGCACAFRARSSTSIVQSHFTFAHIYDAATVVVGDGTQCVLWVRRMNRDANTRWCGFVRVLQHLAPCGPLLDCAGGIVALLLWQRPHMCDDPTKGEAKDAMRVSTRTTACHDRAKEPLIGTN